jgi:hypothetical protein
MRAILVWGGATGVFATGFVAGWLECRERIIRRAEKEFYRGYNFAMEEMESQSSDYQAPES